MSSFCLLSFFLSLSFTSKEVTLDVTMQKTDVRAEGRGKAGVPATRICRASGPLRGVCFVTCLVLTAQSDSLEVGKV